MRTLSPHARTHTHTRLQKHDLRIYRVFQGLRLNLVNRGEMIIFWSLLTTSKERHILETGSSKKNGTILKSNRQ